MGLPEDVEAAIASLGGAEDDRVVDFLVDPGAACRALDEVPEHGGMVIRVAPESGRAATGYAPAPAVPLWIRVMRGAREVGTTTLRGGDGMVRRAARIAVEERQEPCCDAPGCERTRVHAAVWLVLEPVPGHAEQILVAEQRVEGGEAGEAGEPAVAYAVAARLAAAMGVSIQRGGADAEIAAGDPPAPLGEPLPVAELARFGLQTEGSRVVLRDWDSAGPRTSAARNASIGVALMAAGAAGWYALARSLGAGGVSGAAVGAGIVAALLTVAGYAFLGVARFSARYRAASAPLAAIGLDRIVVLPWVSRDGAVDARPEGRLGAAIALGEVRGARARPRPPTPAAAVELDTDHGPIDVMVCPSAAAAERWCAVLDRVIDEARHPRQGATARQRARQRAPQREEPGG